MIGHGSWFKFFSLTASCNLQCLLETEYFENTLETDLYACSDHWVLSSMTFGCTHPEKSISTYFVPWSNCSSPFWTRCHQSDRVTVGMRRLWAVWCCFQFHLCSSDLCSSACFYTRKGWIDSENKYVLYGLVGPIHPRSNESGASINSPSNLKRKGESVNAEPER